MTHTKILIGGVIVPLLLAACQAQPTLTAVMPTTAPKPAATPEPPKPTPTPVPQTMVNILFYGDAFPQQMPPHTFHVFGQPAEYCLECHKEGKRTAPKLVHKDMPEIYLIAECTTCHVLKPRTEPIPPLLLPTEYHTLNISKEECLSCHRDGKEKSPKVKHEFSPGVQDKVYCISCHGIR